MRAMCTQLLRRVAALTAPRRRALNVDAVGALSAACLDHNQTQCHIWADTDECVNNPAAVIKDCPQTCGACSSACTDHDDRCRAWAHDGKCDEQSDHPFMLRVCPATCGVCAKLDQKARPQKGEL